MITELKYTSSIKDMPFMFLEMKRTALLLCDGKSGDEIVKMSVEQNIYQLEKEKRRRDVPLRMIKRLSSIGEPLIKIIARGHDGEAKLAAFLALMKSDRLLFEYMREVYSDKFYSGYEEIYDKDFLEFIDRKAQNDDTVAKWTGNNLAAVRGKIKSTLCDAGMAKRSGDVLMVQCPIVENEFLQLIKEEGNIYAKAMLLEV